MLWAVHISDGILLAPWLLGGFALAGGLALLGAWAIRDEEIPQVALLTAAFFVVSLIHARVGPTTVHLFFNGLLGVMLGRRACLAIPMGLFLQAVLFQHGGYSTLGVNSCIMVLPALAAWALFASLQRVPWVRQPWFRASLVIGSVFLWIESLIYSLVLLWTNHAHDLTTLDTTWANHLTFHPLTLAGSAIVAVAVAVLERRLENAPEFPLGMLVGTITVLLTALLNACVLTWGGQEDWHTLVLVVFVAHLPIAVVEGMVLGFVVGFLVRVKPQMIGWPGMENAECVAESLP